ncbi:MAG: cytochrome c [Hyphomicrobiaceae bacterium]
MSRIALLAAALAACPLVALAQQPEAAPSVAQFIDARQSKMGRSGRELYAIEQAISSGADISTLRQPVQWLVQWSEELPTLFPEGSHSQDGDTRLTIWSDAPGFAAATARFRMAIQALDTAAATNDRAVLRRAIRQVWNSCSSCHAAYTG